MANINDIQNSIEDLKNATAQWMDSAKETMAETISTTSKLVDMADPDYLCFTALVGNSTVAMSTYNNTTTTYKPTVEYSTDKVTWHTLITKATPASPVTLAKAGDKMWVRGDNANFSKNATDYTKFDFTGSIKVSGNIMSLLDKTCKRITLPTSTSSNMNYVFGYLFYNNSVLVDASELVLPALSVGYGCYYSMFRSCSNLVKVPKLPATTLDVIAYGAMFRDCTSLVEAPELPATAVTNNSYSVLFRGCTSLKHIKYPLANFGVNNNWMQDASSTGVFECPSALDCSIRDASHVPAGWTIVRTNSPKSITSPTISSSAATFNVSPSAALVPVLTVTSALTLSALPVDSGSIAYAEVVIDIATGATVTAGTKMTLVDTLTENKRNVCVVRWSGGTAKLYVVLTEDIPA